MPRDPLGRGRAARPAAPPHLPADVGRPRAGQVAARRGRSRPPAGAGGVRSVKRLDRLMNAAADGVLAWSARHAEPADAPWIDALRGELELVDGGPARLLWALGSLSVVGTTRRSIVSRIWRSLPAALRFSLFGLALGVIGTISVVWSNVIVPSHESDDEYQGLYLVLYLGLLVYFAASGFVAARLGSSIRDATLTGLV